MANKLLTRRRVPDRPSWFSLPVLAVSSLHWPWEFSGCWREFYYRSGVWNPRFHLRLRDPNLLDTTPDPWNICRYLVECKLPVESGGLDWREYDCRHYLQINDGHIVWSTRHPLVMKYILKKVYVRVLWSLRWTNRFSKFASTWHLTKFQSNTPPVSFSPVNNDLGLCPWIIRQRRRDVVL